MAQLARSLHRWASAVGLILLPIVAHAADIDFERATDRGPALIFVSGKMELEDGNRFADIAASLGREHAAVIFGSPGGSLIAGLQIGQIIRLRHYATFVPQNTVCASACAFAWLSGSPRIMQERARIGFHAAYIESGGTKTETGVGNALAGAYMTQLGLSVDAIVYVESAHPDDITWLTPEDARKIGLAVRIVPFDPAPTAGPSAEPARPVSVAPAPAARQASARPAHAPSLLTPELTEPQSPPPAATADAADRARLFVGSYFAHWSESNGEAFSYFGKTYARTVTYYGQSVERGTLLQVKQGYAQRWPIRVYDVREPTMRVFCNPAGTICTVSGVVDWDCRNPARDAISKGAANFSLTVALSSDQQQILSESGSVIATD